MSQLPPKARLQRVLSALAKHLPSQLAGLIEATRFDEERPILERFADSDWARRACDAMDDDEAAWMADLLTERWVAVGEVLLEPVAAIEGPTELWVGRRPRSLSLQVVVEGLDEGWSAAWQGDVAAGSTGPVATLEALQPDGYTHAMARVRVEGRAGGKRVLLVDQVRIVLRVPRLVVSEERSQILVRDQDERPASGVAVRIGDAEHRTDSAGRILLDEPAEAGSEVSVDGIFAGRIPPE